MRNSSINLIFLWRLPIQNQSKPSITEKIRNKVKYMTWNSIRLKFVLSKALDISSATTRVVPHLLKALAIISDKTVRRNAVDREDLKLYWNSEKRSHFSSRSTIVLFTKKKTNRAAVFSSRPFPAFLNTSTTYETFQSDQPVCMYERLCSEFLEPPLEYNQDQTP